MFITPRMIFIKRDLNITNEKYENLFRTSYLLLKYTLFFGLISSFNANANIERVYKRHCSKCHGADRLGITASPLLPNVYKKLSKEKAITIIRKGRISTQMPAFKKSISQNDIKKLVEYIFTEPKEKPEWTLDDIKKTITISNKKYKSKLLKTVDPLNLFTVVEIKDHAISILDGDSFKVLKRLKTKPGVHGGAKYSPSGRYMYLSSRDGWVEKFDMWSLKSLGSVRVGINTRNMAVSGDGKLLAVANYIPQNIVILDAQTLAPLKNIPATSKKGQSSRVAAVYTARPRNSFIASMKDIPEIWEIYYKKPKFPVHDGLIHDNRIDSGEGVISKEKYPIRKIYLKNIIENFYFDKNYDYLIGTAHKGQKGQVVNLDVRKKIAALNIQGMPHLGAGITWVWKNKRVIAIPNLKLGMITIINTDDWKVIKEIKTKGPGFFLRSHEKSKYAWGDVFFGPNKDSIYVLDKEKLEIVKTLIPARNKTSGHIEFTKDGKYALVSIWEDDGALVIYNSSTFKEVKRIKMKKPSGKYNVFNKINLSDGTSH